MAIQLHFLRPDNTPWGFSLSGGADFDVPLTVTKICDRSIAQAAGLEVGDVFIRINGDDITSLTHLQAHDVILQGGNDFQVDIIRGHLSQTQNDLIAEQQTDAEVSDILQGTIAEKNYPTNGIDCSKHDLSLTDEDIERVINPENFMAIKKTPELPISENLQGQEEIIHPQNNDNLNKIQQYEEKYLLSHDDEVYERKWSTFLQKPKNPKPKFVDRIEEDKPKVEPYRVVIKTKKMLDAEREAQKKAEEEAAAAALVAAQEAERQAEEERIAEEKRLAEEERLAELARLEEERIKQEEEENDIQPQGDDDGIELEDENNNEIQHFTSRQGSVATSVEQQLQQVKEQLLALTVLPDTLHDTLNLISEQLQKIVQEVQTHDDDEEASVGDNTETEDDITELVALEKSQEDLSVVREEGEFDEQISDLNQVQIEAEDIARSEEDMIAEDIDAQQVDESDVARLAQDKTDKKEKEHMSQQHPLAPLERPIILPGGRKWSQPNDAGQSIRQPSLTDDNIDRTISSYYEVVTGHTIGINFMKYQPPPKNLDHLQNSDVYKMVHEMDDAPPRGITARPGKILAEVDYVVNSSSTHEINAAAQ